MPEKKSKARAKRRPTKDRVLQARIPEQLDEELRDRAAQLGLSVSTIVRNVLLHTFELVEGVVTDSAQIGRALQGRDVASAQPAPDTSQTETEAGIVGWQEVTLNQNATCDVCNTILPLGVRAAIGIPVQKRPTFICLDCLADLSTKGRKMLGKQKAATRTKTRDKKPTP